jgi:CRISPR-associated protein Csb1
MQPDDLLNRLNDACRGGTSAARIVTRLIPAGGPGDKVFPPTYEGGKYARERRRLDGQGEIEAVLLDSVQSQANRIELALLQAFREKLIDLPVLQVRIPRASGDAVVTSLEAPHRVFDAIFRDSLLDGRKFRESALGKRLVAARPDNATALFEACPTALLFGAWDSTGGEGASGTARFPRALTSEIIGLNAIAGRKTSSRLDPLGITADAAIIYRSETDLWTLNEAEAVRDKKGAVKFRKSGKPSEINHGNVTPSISGEGEAGGVTISEAIQTTVLSFPQLRRLRFPDPETGKTSTERDGAARVALAALGLYAVALQREEGYFLRSRCHLVPLSPSRVEFIGTTAAEIEPLDPGVTTLRDTCRLAIERATKQGVPWRGGVIELKPADKLVELVRRSDERTRAAGGEADARA